MSDEVIDFFKNHHFNCDHIQDSFQTVYDKLIEKGFGWPGFKQKNFDKLDNDELKNMAKNIISFAEFLNKKPSDKKNDDLISKINLLNIVINLKNRELNKNNNKIKKENLQCKQSIESNQWNTSPTISSFIDDSNVRKKQPGHVGGNKSEKTTQQLNLANLKKAFRDKLEGTNSKGALSMLDYFSNNKNDPAKLITKIKKEAKYRTDGWNGLVSYFSKVKGPMMKGRNDNVDELYKKIKSLPPEASQKDIDKITKFINDNTFIDQPSATKLQNR